MIIKIIVFISKHVYLDDYKKQEVIFGLKSLWLTIEKLVVIIILSVIFRSFKETIYTFVFVSFLRSFSFGEHFNSKIFCHIYSAIIFVFLPCWFGRKFEQLFIVFIFLITFISFLLFSPSNSRKRNVDKIYYNLKFKILLVLFIYFSLYIFTFNNSILLSILIQSLSINPIIERVLMGGD